MMVLAGFTIVVGIYPDVFLGQIMPYMQGVWGSRQWHTISLEFL